MVYTEFVIKIPKEIQLALINNIQLSADQQSICDSYIKQAIINGKQLPKGHGDLIDRRELKKHVHTITLWCGDDHRVIYELYVDDAPIIIEADKEDNKYGECRVGN